MKIAKHTVPSVTYELTVENEIVDKANEENPLTFLFGVGSMIPGFESQLQGLEKGNSFDFTLSPDEAYGTYDLNAVVSLPKQTFVVDGELKTDMLKVGNMIPMQDQNGNPLRGKIIEIEEENVRMDFNHPLAGKDLAFTGTVIDVREATADEIDHGHVHGPGGHHH